MANYPEYDGGITLYQALEQVFQHVYAYNPPDIPTDGNGGDVPYIVVEEDRDQLNTQLNGTAQLRDDYLGVYLYATDDLALAQQLYYYIDKTKEVVRAHPGVDRFITLLPASGCSRPIYRNDIRRYYAVIRFRIQYLSL